MAHSYPIWNIITEDAYRTGKSYGARDWTRTEVRVGTSKSNSEVLCSHYVKRDPCYGGEWMRFEFGVEDAEGNTLATVRKWMHVESRQWQDVDPGRYIPGALTNPELPTGVRS